MSQPELVRVRLGGMAHTAPILERYKNGKIVVEVAGKRVKVGPESILPSRFAEYRQKARGGPPREPKPHGTVAAARRHQRAHEHLCEPCKAAWAEHQHAMYEKRKAARRVAEILG